MSSTRLPWDIQEFKRSDLAFVSVAAILCVAIPFIDVPLPTPKPLPERLVILPPITEVPPPPPVVEPEPEPIPAPKPEPKPEPTPVPEPVKPVVQPKPEPKPVTKPVIQPRPEPVKPVLQPPKPTPQPPPRPVAPTAVVPPKPVPATPPPPTQAQVRAAAQQRAQAAVKDLGLGPIGAASPTTASRPVNTNTAQTSTNNTQKLTTSASQATQSNLQVAAASKTDKPAVSGTMSDRKSADVSQNQIKDQVRHAAVAATNSGKQERSNGDVVRTINQAKNRLQSAYERALDDDPTMEGAVVVRFKIKADGSVASVVIVSSGLNNKALEDKFLTILKGLKFESGTYEEWSDTHTFNFLPL